MTESIIEKIHKSGLSIYDYIAPTNELYIKDSVLEDILKSKLIGRDIGGLRPRTRSKVVKTMICEALGYPTPKAFTKTHPRFPGQNLDAYVQQSNNLQIWNVDITAEQRYAIIRPDKAGIIRYIRVVRGDTLAQYDKTGTLTTKFQAQMPSLSSQLFSKCDTPQVQTFTTREPVLDDIEPTDFPSIGNVYKIDKLYDILLNLLGHEFAEPSSDRIRGDIIHRQVCSYLGYKNFKDDGQFPDLKNQLLEIKAQTSPTIDLGLHRPASEDIALASTSIEFKTSDMRYAIFACKALPNQTFRIEAIYVTTGKDFPNHFRMFKGKEQNSKLQLPLPSDFFDHNPKEV
ncbi:restriction endonuclease [Bifidobacterium pseudolongum]|uniref:restriction endonuclease n=1 Tax=Bifidobacterium pseudolongum TaxID=1694 RepID=UPI00101F0569|nr:restriction endonuclease [Bifidobacterium pseudolongum]RYQ64136.1 restriction endonuclease [Bifidobacterium pseudolongum subsp. globosum]